ncbi:hypothetical protein PUN28_015125 [Cardiocondyla obscurior]|uniref:Uncharacterized protein n=1 Tax=Cardiocondyla obscurior TaxID=286306 RepID=A0AAW2EX90_9HYME
MRFVKNSIQLCGNIREITYIDSRIDCVKTVRFSDNTKQTNSLANLSSQECSRKRKRKYVRFIRAISESKICTAE